jgi:5-methyltetrahydrofolate--homocysteine methyltransferase
MASFDALSQAVVAGKEAQVVEYTKALVDAGVNPIEIINNGLIAGMNIVGPLFKNGDMFVPEVLMSAKAMASGVDIVKRLIAEKDMPSSGKIVIATVKGDLHDIGKNLVAMMLESGGFTVINLGIDIAPEVFAKAVKEHHPDIVGLSALLTTTMPNMKETIDVLKEEGLREQVKIMVGGAPISQEYADKIGADAFAPDAASAVEICKKLVNA